MPRTTHFHPRIEPLNQTRIWKHWSGYLVAPRYQYSELAEYYAIRNSVAVLDTSPLFKYRFSGADANRLLSFALTRDIATCQIGQAQYTCWCDDAGFVVQDGVVMRTAADEYWLTSAEPSLRYFILVAKEMGLEDVEIRDVSQAFGILAVQGPHSISVLRSLNPAIEGLGYFDCGRFEVAGCNVKVSRTGFTGDLGYELWIEADDALHVWDALFDQGSGFNIVPLGTTALKMARVEAGLLLLDVDFHSSRFAWVDAQRETPIELGWRWMIRGLANSEREFRGRAAIEKEIQEKSSRWVTVGLEVDWHDYERVHVEAGVLPPKQDVYQESTFSIYRRGDQQWDYAGYATSLLYSSLLKRPIAIAKLPFDLAAAGTEVDIELTVIRKPVNVLARVAKMPFYDPPRKKACLQTVAAVASADGRVGSSSSDGANDE